MLYATMSPGDVKKLTEELKQTKDVRWYQRLKIIVLSAKEKSVPELATLFDRCEATIRTYMKQYNAKGLDGLRPKSQHGAPP